MATDQSFDELFLAHRQTLVRSLHRMVGSSHTAEDLVQEAYLKVRAALDDRQVFSLQPFLYRTAHNLALDHLRLAKIRATTVQPGTDPEVMNAIPSIVPSPERAFGDKQQLHHVLATLPEKRRTILILARLHGWTYQQIADHLGLSESAVQKNLQLAIAQCLAASAEEGGAE